MSNGDQLDIVNCHYVWRPWGYNTQYYITKGRRYVDCVMFPHPGEGNVTTTVEAWERDHSTRDGAFEAALRRLQSTRAKAADELHIERIDDDIDDLLKLWGVTQIRNFYGQVVRTITPNGGSVQATHDHEG